MRDIGDGGDRQKNRPYSYIAERLGDDWGFWYNATTNLDRVKNHMDVVAVHDESQKAHMTKRCDELLDRVEAARGPSSLRNP